jgi:hypothetical protein
MSILDDHCTATAAQQFTTVEADAIRANSFCFTLFFPFFFVFSRVVGSQCVYNNSVPVQNIDCFQCSFRRNARSVVTEDEVMHVPGRNTRKLNVRKKYDSKLLYQLKN